MERYRLGSVRDVRQRDERVKRGELADAVDDARATADEVAAAERRVAAARDKLEAARAMRFEVTPAGLHALAERHLLRRRRDLEAALAEEDRAEARHAGRLDAIDTARGHLGRARAQRELIERHFARWRDTQRKLAERRED